MVAGVLAAVLLVGCVGLIFCLWPARKPNKEDQEFIDALNNHYRDSAFTKTSDGSYIVHRSKTKDSSNDTAKPGQSNQKRRREDHTPHTHGIATGSPFGSVGTSRVDHCTSSSGSSDFDGGRSGGGSKGSED